MGKKKAYSLEYKKKKIDIFIKNWRSMPDGSKVGKKKKIVEQSTAKKKKGRKKWVCIGNVFDRLKRENIPSAVHQLAYTLSEHIILL